MKLISEINISDRTLLRLQTGEYRGQEKIDLRLYVKTDKEIIPTPKGINFNAEWRDDFIKMVEKLKDE